jgi:hypothetical protein
MVDHVYGDAATEPAWHDWYAGYLEKLVAVPGIDTAQRFRALDCSPPRYLAMYSVASADVYESDAYRNMGGGGSQSARFHDAYRLWTRNLFEGASRAPIVREGQRVLVFDREHRDETGPFASRATWLEAVGLHMTTRYRAFVVLDAGEAASTASVPGSYLYEPFTRVVLSRVSCSVRSPTDYTKPTTRRNRP